MNWLVDTNICLEILLGQPNRERCRQFLQENSGRCGLSDFSLHSIGVIAFRGHRDQAYQRFIHDALPGFALLHMDKRSYYDVLHAHQQFGLDFDDAYQFTLARINGLVLVTQDRHFENVRQEISVRFL